MDCSVEVLCFKNRKSHQTVKYCEPHLAVLEQRGILRSERDNNGYRYYDVKNTVLIKKIVLLRALRMPIAKIEQFYISITIGVRTEIMSPHLNNLQHLTYTCNALSALVICQTRCISAKKSTKQAFDYLNDQIQNISPASEQKKTL